MPLFVCETCGVVDNSAYGTYYEKLNGNMKKAECSQCWPKMFGGWHDFFPREEWKEGVLVLNPPEGKTCWNCKVGPVPEGSRCPRCSKRN